MYYGADYLESLAGTANRAYVPCGVGVTVQQTEDGLLKVLGVVTGSDLMVGDVLLNINGESVRGHAKEASILQRPLY